MEKLDDKEYLREASKYDLSKVPNIAKYLLRLKQRDMMIDAGFNGLKEEDLNPEEYANEENDENPGSIRLMEQVECKPIPLRCFIEWRNQLTDKDVKVVWAKYLNTSANTCQDFAAKILKNLDEADPSGPRLHRGPSFWQQFVERLYLPSNYFYKKKIKPIIASFLSSKQTAKPEDQEDSDTQPKLADVEIGDGKVLAGVKDLSKLVKPHHFVAWSVMSCLV